MTDTPKPDDFAAQQAILQARQRDAKEREIAFRLAQEKEMERLLSGHFGVASGHAPAPPPAVAAAGGPQHAGPPRRPPERVERAGPASPARPPSPPSAPPPQQPEQQEQHHMRPPPKPALAPMAPPAAPAAPPPPPPQPVVQPRVDAGDVSSVDRGDTLVHQISGTVDRTLLYITTGTSILDAVRFLASRKIGLALVCDPDGSLAGVLSERDVIRSIAARGAEILGMAVDPFITTDVVTCQSVDRVVDVAQMMSARRIRHVPIVDDGVLKGMISATDIINFYAMTEGGPDSSWE